MENKESDIPSMPVWNVDLFMNMVSASIDER